ncbi:cupin domain-containing protein [Thalassoglobus sp.]|uniref:cupin domain-containing protein n=1 Tax=Thalassoglobus sp. TaxID=2795869 RepID=UPI003AA8B997
MAIPHAQPGEIIDVRPLGDNLQKASTKALVKTGTLEVIRMVLPAGKVLKDHSAPGEILVQCIEGKFAFTSMGETKHLEAGEMLYLSTAEEHSVEAIEDSSFLLTILLPEKDASSSA